MKINMLNIAVSIMIGTASSHANLLVNSDFESGNTGFTSFYNYMSGSSGGYVVGNDSKAWNGNFPDSLYDHTTGSGLMLLCDGSNNRSIAWQQTVDVVEGVEYEFAGWVASLYTRSFPDLEFMVNGESIGHILTHYLTWEQFSATWIATQSGSVTLSIRDLNTQWLGNDFAIDDLSFEATSTLLPPVIHIENSLNAVDCVEAAGPDGTVITASVGNFVDDPSIVYYWSNSDGVMTNGATFDFLLGLNQSAIIFLTVEDAITGETASSFEQVCVSDTTSPEIIILSPEYGDTVTGNNLFLDVKITDAVDSSIKDYTVNMGSMATYPLDSERGTSRVKLSKPAKGTAAVPTDITVTVQDASGNSSTATVQVMQLHDRRKK